MCASACNFGLKCAMRVLLPMVFQAGSVPNAGLAKHHSQFPLGSWLACYSDSSSPSENGRQGCCIDVLVGVQGLGRLTQNP